MPTATTCQTALSVGSPTEPNLVDRQAATASRSFAPDLSELTPVEADIEVANQQHSHLLHRYWRHEQHGSAAEIDALDKGQSNAAVALVCTPQSRFRARSQVSSVWRLRRPGGRSPSPPPPLPLCARHKAHFDCDGLSSGEQRTLDRELVELQLQPARLPEIGGEGLDPGFISLPPLSEPGLARGTNADRGVGAVGPQDGLELAPFLDGDDKIRPHSLNLVALQHTDRPRTRERPLELTWLKDLLLPRV